MYNKLIILFACILFLLKIYENKVVKNNIDGMLNKLILILLVFFVTFENFPLGLILMIILMEILYNNSYNNEKFQCVFQIKDNREP